MDVVVSIGGRAALPVRAIPFLTDWEVLSPDVVAKIFAGEDARARRLRGLQAFRLDGGAVLPMAERAWSTVSADLRELESTLAAGTSAHRDWRRKSTELLPAGVFVWKDEFERSYEREYGKGGRTRWNLPEEEDSRRLDFSPFVAPELQQLVMEGFEATHGQPHTPAMRAQEQLVIEAIRSLGHDSKALPRRAPGKPWVKADVRAKVGTGPSGEFKAQTAFDATWERLRAGGEIREI